MIKISELDKIIEDVRYRKIDTLEGRVKVLSWIRDLEPDEVTDLVKKLTIPVVVGSENCNKCKKEISIDEFNDGMGECLVCFPKF